MGIFKDTMKIKYVPINELKPAEYNPRKKNPSTYEKIKKSITQYGLVVPLVVNKYTDRENVVVGGHIRLICAKELGFTEVPVVYVSLPLKTEKKLNLRLNKNNGEWDENLLKLIDEDILSDVGFGESEIKKLLGKDSGVPGVTDDEGKENKLRPKTDYIVVQFSSKEQKASFQNTLEIDKKTKSVDWDKVKGAYKI